MKKVTLFLVPIVMLSLAGCGKAPASPALDPYEQDIQDVINLKEVENYESRLGEEQNYTTCYNAIMNQVRNNAVSFKYVYRTYNATSYIDEDRINIETRHYQYQIYDTFATAFDKVTIVEDISISTEEKTTKKTTEIGKYFYDPATTSKYYYDIYNGEYSLSGWDISDQSAEDQDAIVENEWNEAKTFCFVEMDMYGFKFYKTTNGYTGYKYSKNEMNDTYHFISTLQTIYEFDNDFHLIKGTYFSDDYSNRNHIDDSLLPDMKLEISYHGMFFVDYGERDSKATLVDMVEEGYNSPYINSGNVTFNGADVDEQNYKTFKTGPKTMRLEAYAAFNSLNSDEVDVTPNITVRIFDSMYQYNVMDAKHNISVTDRFNILTQANLRYDDNYLMFRQNKANDAVYFVMEVEVVDGEVVVNKATAEMVDKLNIKDYFDSL